MYNILTVGDIKLDTFIVIPEASVMCQLKMPSCQLCLEYGKKIPVQEISSQIAGTASNVAIGIAKMDRIAAIYSVMGQDSTRALAFDFLEERNVITKLITTDKKRQSSFAAVLNYKGETTQLVSHSDFVYHLPKKLPPTEWMHISELGDGYEKMYLEAIKCAKNQDIKISLNPGSIQLLERREELFDLIKSSHVLFLNMSEAKTLLKANGELALHSMMAKLKQLGPQYVVVTDGKNGAYAFDGKQLDFAPAYSGKMIEATGAGDAFSTGFLGAIMHDKGHDEALTWGAVNAASVIGLVGPTAGLLTHTEIKKRLKAKPSYRVTQL